MNEVVIVEYDPRWPALFESERALIAGALPEPPDAIEHIGSTAVPGLAAKPVIDVLIGVRDIGRAADWIAPLAALGYRYVPAYERELPARRYFRKGDGPDGGGATHHLHVVERGSAFFREHLALRDLLRREPARAAEYGALKRRLAGIFRDDRAAYLAAKSAWIAEALDAPRTDAVRVRSFKLRVWDEHAWIVPATDAAGCAFAGPGVTLRGTAARVAFAYAAPLFDALARFEPGIVLRSVSVDRERPRLLATLEPAAPARDARPRVVRMDAGPALGLVLAGTAPLVRHLAARVAEALARRAPAHAPDPDPGESGEPDERA